jgi:hypothetical protein
MRTKILIGILLFPLISFCQVAGAWFFNDNGNDQLGVSNLTANNITYDGNSAIFNGTSSYFNGGDIMDLRAGDFTVSYILLTTTTLITVPVCKATARTQIARWASIIWSSTQLNALRTLSNGQGMTPEYVYTAPVTDGKYHLVTTVWDRDVNLYVYLDGVSVGSASISSITYDHNNSDRFLVGAYGTSSNTSQANYFNGKIKSVVIDRSAYSPARVKNDFTYFKGMF